MVEVERKASLRTRGPNFDGRKGSRHVPRPALMLMQVRRVAQRATPHTLSATTMDSNEHHLQSHTISPCIFNLDPEASDHTEKGITAATGAFLTTLACDCVPHIAMDKERLKKGNKRKTYKGTTSGRF